MKALNKKIAGAAAAALITVSAATPAYADHRRGHNDGIDMGDVITGVAVVAGIAAVASAIGNQGRYQDPYARNTRGYGYPAQAGYGYPAQGYGYGGYGGEQIAVNACARYAQRYGGQVQITDVRRDGRRSFDVYGVINTGYATYNRGYDPRYDRGYNRGYGYGGQIAFECDVRDNGRVTDFDTRRYR